MTEPKRAPNEAHIKLIAPYPEPGIKVPLHHQKTGLPVAEVHHRGGGEATVTFLASEEGEKWAKEVQDTSKIPAELGFPEGQGFQILEVRFRTEPPRPR